MDRILNNKLIYTSYLNKRISWNQLNITRIRICRWVHKGQESRYDIMIPELFPLKEHLEEELSWDEYVHVYIRDILNRLDPIAVYDKLPHHCVLLCHEIDNHQCHRSLVAKWLMENIKDISVEEWLSADEQKLKQHQQFVEKFIEF